MCRYVINVSPECLNEWSDTLFSLAKNPLTPGFPLTLSLKQKGRMVAMGVESRRQGGGEWGRWGWSLVLDLLVFVYSFYNNGSGTRGI